MKFKKLPEELKPTQEDYDYFEKENDLLDVDVDELFQVAWEDYIDWKIKEDFNEYKSECRDERNEEKENGDLVPPFDEWHEAIKEYILNLENYIEHNKEEIFRDFKESVRDIEVSLYFEDE